MAFTPQDLNLTSYGGDVNQIQKEYYRQLGWGRSHGAQISYQNWMKDQRRQQQYGIGVYGDQPVAPTPEQAAMAQRREWLKSRKGYASTLLTGGMGATEPATLSRRTLLGG